MALTPTLVNDSCQHPACCSVTQWLQQGVLPKQSKRHGTWCRMQIWPIWPIDTCFPPVLTTNQRVGAWFTWMAWRVTRYIPLITVMSLQPDIPSKWSLFNIFKLRHQHHHRQQCLGSPTITCTNVVRFLTRTNFLCTTCTYQFTSSTYWMCPDSMLEECFW